MRSNHRRYVMIHSALDFLTKILNQHIQSITGSTESHVFLTNISDGNGVTIPAKALGISLVSIEEERVFKEQRTSFLTNNGKVEYKNPEIKLNLYVMVSANFQNQDANDPTDDYIEGLKQLSYVIGYFQSRNVFTQDQYPLMATAPFIGLQKLVVEFYSYSFEQMYNFWSVLGTHYLPSVLYRVRLVSIQEDNVGAIQLPIEEIVLDTSHS